MDKIELALQLSEEILSGIETGSLNTSTVALRSLRLARLISDATAIQWFQYETTGYPTESDGHMENQAFIIACNHGRNLISNEDGTQRIFPELADELELTIQSTQKTIGNLTTSVMFL